MDGPLCCMDTATLKWTRHADTQQIFKNIHDTRVGYTCPTHFGYDTAS